LSKTASLATTRLATVVTRQRCRSLLWHDRSIEEVHALVVEESHFERSPSNGKGIEEATSGYGQGWKSWKAVGVSFGQ